MSSSESAAVPSRIRTAKPLLRRILLTAGGLALAAPHVRAQDKPHGVALVIGNSKYNWESSLPNAKRDAVDFAKRFEQMGFATVLIENASRGEMESALGNLSKVARGAPLAAFYFAGHGVALEKSTYLVPTDVDLTDPSIVKSLITTRTVINAAQDASYRFLIFDNCRNSPADGWEQVTVVDRALGNGIYQYGDGQALPPNTATIFSTAPGRAALDGRAGENSPFAKVLLRLLGAKSVDLFHLNPILRRRLLIETDGRQLIWGDHSLTKSHIIAGAGVDHAPAPSLEPGRIVELKKAYDFAKEIDSPVPWGLIAVRPAKAFPAAQMVGSFKYNREADWPHLVIVLGIDETNKSASLIQSARFQGKPYWRYIQGTISNETLEFRTWAKGNRFTLKWRDTYSGSVVISGNTKDSKMKPIHSTFSRLDG